MTAREFIEAAKKDAANPNPAESLAGLLDRLGDEARAVRAADILAEVTLADLAALELIDA